MRKTLFGILMIVTLSLQSFAQELSGKYVYQDEFLDFKPNGVLEFNLLKQGGFSSLYQGVGSYVLVDGVLKVTLTKLSKPVSSIQLLDTLTSPGYVTVSVVDAEMNKSLLFLNVLIVDNDNRIIKHQILRDGFIRFPIDDYQSGLKMKVSYSGYPSFFYEIPSGTKSDCLVRFSPYNTFEATQKFLLDGKTGFGIKVLENALSIGRNYDGKPTPDFDGKGYFWHEFKKE